MNSSEWSNKLSSCANYATNFDTFGESFAFKLPGNKTKHGTPLGCCFTALLVLTLLFQTMLKGSTLVNFDETTLNQHEEQDYFNSSSVFSSNDGFKVAFAITAYDSNQTITEDPSYGVVQAKYRSWGDEIVSKEQAELTTHPCSEQELGLTAQTNEGDFWKVNERSRRDVENFKPKFKCIDQDIQIQGDYNSDVAQRLEIQFVKCSNKTVGGCKSDAEIMAWLRRKFIITLTN